MPGISISAGRSDKGGRKVNPSVVRPTLLYKEILTLNPSLCNPESFVCHSECSEESRRSQDRFHEGSRRSAQNVFHPTCLSCSPVVMQLLCENSGRVTYVFEEEI